MAFGYKIAKSRVVAVTSGFVLGFVVGWVPACACKIRIMSSDVETYRVTCSKYRPLLWAPLSELHGRRYLFIFTYVLFTIFNGGVIASQNIWTLIILRFFAGTAGSSPLTNAG